VTTGSAMKEKRGAKAERTVLFSLIKVFHWSFLHIYKAEKIALCTHYLTSTICSPLPHTPFQPKYFKANLRHHIISSKYQKGFLNVKEILRHNHNTVIMPNKLKNNFLFLPIFFLVILHP
jgi:hypothetical protein